MSFSVSSSIFQAVAFLTKPLSFVRAPTFLNVLQSTLRTVLNRSFLESPRQRLTLTFSSVAPPREINGVCMALGIEWADWIEFFGQQNFDLIVEANKVYARYHDASSTTVTIWNAAQMTPSKRSLLARLSVPEVAQVPIRKLNQQPRTTKPTPVAAPPRIALPSASLYPRIRTVAQQLIDSDNEDELFAMISKTSIVSPTPTRERFPAATIPISPISSPEPSESSRPSSRNSTFSGFSEEGSVSSASSVSVESLDAEAEQSTVFVDTSKNNKTKYLYQGGVSSTLTGGVMLGRPAAKPTTAPSAPAPQKYRVPATRAVSFPPAARVVAPSSAPAPQPKYRAPFARSHSSGANASSWRRAAAPLPVGGRRF